MDMMTAFTLHLVRRRQMGGCMGVHSISLSSFGKLYGVAMTLETEVCAAFVLRGVLLVATLAGNAMAFVSLFQKSVFLCQTPGGIKGHESQKQQWPDNIENYA